MIWHGVAKEMKYPATDMVLLGGVLAFTPASPARLAAQHTGLCAQHSILHHEPGSLWQHHTQVPVLKTVIATWQPISCSWNDSNAQRQLRQAHTVSLVQQIIGSGESGVPDSWRVWLRLLCCRG